MARHTKVFNALLSFYVGSIDEIISELCNAYDKRFFEQSRLDELKRSFNSEVLAVFELAKDQSIHFCNNSELIGEWEKESLVDQIATYATRATGKLKRDGVLGKGFVGGW